MFVLFYLGHKNNINNMITNFYVRSLALNGIFSIRGKGTRNYNKYINLITKGEGGAFPVTLLCDFKSLNFYSLPIRV